MPLLWNICTSALFPTPASPDIATSAYSQRSHTSVLLCFLSPAQPYGLAFPSNTAQAGSGQVRPITRTLQRIIGGGGPEKNGFCVMLPILAAELRTAGEYSNRFSIFQAFEFLRKQRRRNGSFSPARCLQETPLCPRGVEMDRPNNGLAVLPIIVSCSAAPSRQRHVHSPCAFRSEAASGLP